MRKSPGKWIKTIIFGKKSSRSGFSKNAASKKKASFAAEVQYEDSTVDSPVIADPQTLMTNRSTESSLLEKGTSVNLSCDAVELLCGNHIAGADDAGGLNSADNVELAQWEEAAIKAQAAFRGYWARQTFRALKSIIRLQALIRGRLVRRQAVATLHCMQAIVKFQALIRGKQVRFSDAGLEDLKIFEGQAAMEHKGLNLSGVNSFCISDKLSRNAFVIKLLVSSRTFMPLSLQYDVAEPNSVWSWLERWSAYRFWEPSEGVKKIVDSKHQKKQPNVQSVERESGRSKRGVQNGHISNGDSNSLHSTSDYEKSKHHQKKSLNHQVESTQEHPQSELERVKRNLRKVSVLSEEASDKSEVVSEKLQNSRRKVSSSPLPDASQIGMDNSSEKTSDPTSEVPDQPEAELPTKSSTVLIEPLQLHDEQPATEQHPSHDGEKVNDPLLNEELSSKEDQNKENLRTRRRRSLPLKQEYHENVSQNTPTLPSYMAATESAKAKLRAQGLLGSDQDGAENGFIRRHSLPSSTNGKMSSLSPRVQRPVLANGKGGSRSDRSLMSSGDDKPLQQPGWRR